MISGDLFSNTSILDETIIINTAKRNHESLENQLENYRTTKDNNYIMETVIKVATLIMMLLLIMLL